MQIQCICGCNGFDLILPNFQSENIDCYLNCYSVDVYTVHLNYSNTAQPKGARLMHLKDEKYQKLGN